MATYKVQVATGDYMLAGTYSSISITLVGTRGENPKHRLDNRGKDFIRGAVDEYDIPCEQDLGPLVLIRLHKEKYLFFPEDSWYCSYVRVTNPQGETFHFPSYQWLEGYKTLNLREGTAKTVANDSGIPHLLELRAEELKKRRRIFSYGEYAPGWPRCHNVSDVDDLDANSKYLFSMSAVFAVRAVKSEFELRLKGFSGLRDSWKTLEDIRKVFWFNKTPVSEYVTEHWMDDDFFGYQYLNGVNPVMIRKCTQIPDNFPVTQEMVGGCLGTSTSLQEEMKNGNIFIVDYKILDGIPTCEIEGKPQYITAPLCMFHLNSKGQMMPLAIQLQQTPGAANPIFLPTDRKWDWTLAKIWVRLANFHVHEVNTHLLEAHFMAEVYAMATLRHLPMCHPIFKLLIPHTRYIFHINTLARTSLLKAGGLLDTSTSTGRDGMLQLLARGTQTVKYSSLCLPDDLKERGVTEVPNYYYKEDGMRIWTAIEKYVSGVVGFYYKSDSMIKDDKELQAWIQEIFKEAFLSRKDSGAPSSLETAAELIKFLSMIIYCCSIRHAAVNSGQFDFAAWMPNTPATMRQPPPKVKGTASLESILDTLPDVSSTCSLLVVLSVVSYELGDLRRLGYFPDEHFSEEEPKRHMAAFQASLAAISKSIEERNSVLPLAYNYINPAVVENSITV
ncbi:arachidonate 12-lipoxygenase, 12R-type [Anolis carolinensis]|uniref:arachidonate 12-lipoxygenase, 12R-type n=1 Tax=Anolis carolinensis TaxID=28377 RepID=UPI002F2B43EA